MVIGLAHGKGSEPRPADVLLSILDVGQTPVHLALKPDGGEDFVSNYDSDTISEISTPSNEVGGVQVIMFVPEGETTREGPGSGKQVSGYYRSGSDFRKDGEAVGW